MTPCGVHGDWVDIDGNSNLSRWPALIEGLLIQWGSWWNYVFTFTSLLMKGANLRHKSSLVVRVPCSLLTHDYICTWSLERNIWELNFYSGKFYMYGDNLILPGYDSSSVCIRQV